MKYMFAPHYAMYEICAIAMNYRPISHLGNQSISQSINKIIWNEENVWLQSCILNFHRNITEIFFNPDSKQKYEGSFQNYSHLNLICISELRSPRRLKIWTPEGYKWLFGKVDLKRKLFTQGELSITPQYLVVAHLLYKHCQTGWFSD